MQQSLPDPPFLEGEFNKLKQHRRLFTKSFVKRYFRIEVGKREIAWYKKKSSKECNGSIPLATLEEVRRFDENHFQILSPEKNLFLFTTDTQAITTWVAALKAYVQLIKPYMNSAAAAPADSKQRAMRSGSGAPSTSAKRTATSLSSQSSRSLHGPQSNFVEASGARVSPVERQRSSPFSPPNIQLPPPSPQGHPSPRESNSPSSPAPLERRQHHEPPASPISPKPRRGAPPQESPISPTPRRAGAAQEEAGSSPISSQRSPLREARPQFMPVHVGSDSDSESESESERRDFRGHHGSPQSPDTRSIARSPVFQEPKSPSPTSEGGRSPIVKLDASPMRSVKDQAPETVGSMPPAQRYSDWDMDSEASGEEDHSPPSPPATKPSDAKESAPSSPASSRGQRSTGSESDLEGENNSVSAEKVPSTVSPGRSSSPTRPLSALAATIIAKKSKQQQPSWDLNSLSGESDWDEEPVPASPPAPPLKRSQTPPIASPSGLEADSYPSDEEDADEKPAVELNALALLRQRLLGGSAAAPAPAPLPPAPPAVTQQPTASEPRQEMEAAQRLPPPPATKSKRHIPSARRHYSDTIARVTAQAQKPPGPKETYSEWDEAEEVDSDVEPSESQPPRKSNATGKKQQTKDNNYSEWDSDSDSDSEGQSSSSSDSSDSDSSSGSSGGDAEVEPEAAPAALPPPQGSSEPKQISADAGFAYSDWDDEDDED